jgi:RHS repeat-associated protein
MLTGLSNNTSPTANLATVTYNARGLEDSLNFQTTTGSQLATEQFVYDANLRATSSTATWQSGSGSSGTIFSQTRSYDPGSNVISLSTTQAVVPGKSGSGGSETENFCYNEQNRLVWAGNSGTQPSAGNGTCGNGTLSNSLSGASYNNSFVYTHLGQIWQSPLNGGSTQYQYLYCDSTHPHQLTGVYPAGTTCSSKSGQVYTSSYDSWGNVTSRFYNGTTATLSYDALDRLTEWNAGVNSQEWYVYDALGNRVLRRSTNGSGTTITTYAFGIEEHNYTGSGVNQSNQYYYALSGRLLGSSNGTSTTFFLTDALGSVLASLSNTAGSAAINGNQDYGPYGNRLYTQGTIGTARGFTGQYNDALTGLDYYNARYYDPVIGRFLSADTVEGNMQGVDPYAYVSNNPETSNDPTGHCGGWWDVGCEAQQAWNQTTQVAQTIWNDGFVQPFNSTAHALQTAWNDGFVRPWNASVQAYQHMQDLVVKPLISFATKVVIAVVAFVLVTVALIALIGHAARSGGRPANKIAQKIYDKTHTQWRKGKNSNDRRVNYGGGYLQISGSGGKTLLDGKYSYDDKNSPFYSPGPNPGHTEEQVVRWARDIIEQYKAGLTSGGTIRLLIFTRKPPCVTCQIALQSTWIAALKQAAGNSNVTIEITVWYLDPDGNVIPWNPKQ